MTKDTNEEVSDDMLMALADGELPEPESRALRQRIGRDSALAERFALFAETAAVLRAAYGNDPVPDRLVAAVLAGQSDTARPEARNSVVPLRRSAPLRAAAVWQMALAASVVLAVGVAGFVAGRGPGGAAAGPASAAAALSLVATGGTAALADGRTARALASYDTEIGLCRLIGIEGGTGSERVIACRADGDWQVALAVTAGNAGGYVPASDLAVELVDGFLDGIGAGSALDASAEAAALRR